MGNTIPYQTLLVKEAAFRLCSTCRLSCRATVASSVRTLKVHSVQIRWCNEMLQVCAAVSLHGPFVRCVGNFC